MPIMKVNIMDKKSYLNRFLPDRFFFLGIESVDVFFLRFLFTAFSFLSSFLCLVIDQGSLVFLTGFFLFPGHVP